ncbi:MAG: Crp/Fnr family transcriptional regulator [Spirochaetes bacterium]|nr:Crp/Fnr family transcriptional regulator [Spirochaetota bacterium]
MGIDTRGLSVAFFNEGDVIFRQGDPGNVMYILVSGAVELRIKVEKGEKLLKCVDTPHDFFGEMALVDGSPRSATAIAVKPTKLIVVDETQFEKIVLTNGKFAWKIIQVLSQRIRNSNMQISELVELGLRERVQRGMTDYALKFGEKIYTGGLKIPIQGVKEWLNTRLGIAMTDIDSVIFRLLKDETISYAPTSTKTKDHIVLSEEFIRANNRRS